MILRKKTNLLLLRTRSLMIETSHCNYKFLEFWDYRDQLHGKKKRYVWKRLNFLIEILGMDLWNADTER